MTISIRSIPLSAVALSALLACGAARAQSSVTLYGVMETGLRYSTNNDADGHGKAEMAGGYYSGSRFGIRGSEDLGNGLKAVFHLVSGFAPDTGVGSTNDMGLGGYKPTRPMS
ncbi:porin, partial [Corynebacterium sp. 35RC1]|nr:porin [Corynebacterium sp. 35RC1]